MISIVEYPPDWGFGNRLLYYNNLRQLAEKHHDSWSTVPFEGWSHFKDSVQYSRGANNILRPCLGEKFFEEHCVSTRKIFRLIDEPDVPDNTAAIHFRGTDFFQWNSKAVLDAEYYLNAIEEIKDDVSSFILFADDTSLPSFNRITKYLYDNDISFEYGENSNDRSNYINDFRKMCFCDYIISSPSTYNICAGFIGKHKKIIHSDEWVRERCYLEDKFWCDLYNGGNYDYKLWRLI